MYHLDSRNGKHLESTRDRGEGRIIASVINGLADYAIMEVGLVCRCKGCNLRQSNGGEVRARSRTSKAWLGLARLGELVKKEV